MQLPGFFANQLDYGQRASTRFEKQTKDTAHVAEKRVAQVCNYDCPLDKSSNLYAQTERGLLRRALLASIRFAKGPRSFFTGEVSPGGGDGGGRVARPPVRSHTQVSDIEKRVSVGRLPKRSAPRARGTTRPPIGG